MSSLEETLCESISLIVNKAISEASYDKTVQATVVSCVDSTIGKYKVSYQNSTFYAYSTNTDVTYTNNSTVYVLIPANDTSDNKTIIGTVKKLGVNYVTTLEGKDAYYVNGINVLTSSSDSYPLEMSSWYPGTYAKVLYSKDNDEEDNVLDIDVTAIEQYLKTSENIICGASIQTSLATEQQYNGNYGIIFALDFLDNTGNDVVTRYYTVDVDKMTGNPYRLLLATDQYGIFDIDYSNFIEINYISIFCYGFPNSSDNEEDWVNDISISDIYLYGATALSSDEASGYALTFLTPQGTYFTSSSLDSDELTIQAQVRVKGSIIDTSSQTLEYYWFSEHAGINSQSFEYNKYGGQGWKCLNDYNKVAVTNYDSEGEEVLSYVADWVPGSDELVLKKSEVAAASVTYKCVAIYDSTIISNTITIKNLGSGYEVTIESDSGTQFYYDIGSPTLTCLVNGESNTDSYTYSWSVTDNSGTYSSIAETTDIDAEYNAILAEYNELLSKIDSGEVWAAEVADEISQLEVQLASYDGVQRVEANVIYNLDVSSIVSFSRYTCTVYYGELYIGTVSITIVNSLSAEGTYTLVINNGTYAYKYNENGISPASNSVDSPIEIPALSFTVYDNNGEDITDTCYSYVKWEVPASNTMLEADAAYDSYIVSGDGEDPIVYQQGDENSAYTLSNLTLQNFVYSIAGSYNASYSNNDIKLTVYLRNQKLLLEATTNLTFTKEGESGTNGTEYTCKIVPNVASGADTPKNVIVTQKTDGSWSLNYTPRASNRWFRVQMYHNETLILDTVTSANTDEGVAATVEWSILRNTYTSSVSDTTSLSVNSSTGVFSYSGYLTTHPANIVKVTITYNNITYYATYPVITVKLSNDNYKAILKDGTGFKYATYTSDGLTPKYDNSNPFTILVTQTTSTVTDGDATEKNASGSAATYTWSYLGRVYESAWVVQSYLEKNSSYSGELADNQLAVKPAKSFDGQCVTNALQCVIAYSGTEVARIHIPVHLLLNKYGLASLNGWDGNSVEIDTDGGFILAPQVGAGIKESDNSFTGIVMGAVKESGSSETEVGLFGYSSGLRSIFLDAYTGKAEFGTSISGKIVIDPTDDTLLIYSSDYVSGSSGLLIDLSTPQIVYGNGNFSVNANGYITAKGGGTIAGFSIDDDSLWTGTKTSSTNVRISSVNFTRTVNGQSDSAMRMAFSNNFGVNSSGNMYAASGTIGSGSQKITLGKSSASSSYSAIYSGSKSALNSSATTGFYVGTDGIAVGSNFTVTSAGNLTARNANFSGTITGSSITGSTMQVGAFSVDEDMIVLGDFNISTDGSNVMYSDNGLFSVNVAYGPNSSAYADVMISSDIGGSTEIMGGYITSTYRVKAGFFESTAAYALSSRGYTYDATFYDILLRAGWWGGWTVTETCESMWNSIKSINNEIDDLWDYCRSIDVDDDDDDEE